MSIPAAPEGYATVNPFIITTGAEDLTRFVIDVFGGEERAEARTVDDDGLLLQAEVRVGTTTIMLAERKPDWPFTPSLLQIYVDDLDAVLERALARGVVWSRSPPTSSARSSLGCRIRVRTSGGSGSTVMRSGTPMKAGASGRQRTGIRDGVRSRLSSPTSMTRCSRR